MLLGCQTFTWEMLGDRWRGTTDDILDAIAGAGVAFFALLRSLSIARGTLPQLGREPVGSLVPRTAVPA